MIFRKKMLFAVSAAVLSTSAFAESQLLYSGGRWNDLSAPFRAISEQVSLVESIENFARSLGLVGSVSVQPIAEVASLGIRTVKSQLSIEGIPVHGGILSVHKSKLGEMSFTSTIPAVQLPSLKPAISERNALAIASLYSNSPLARAPELRLYQNSARTKMDLVWWVDFRSTDDGTPGVEVVLNAQTGKLVGEISKLHSANEIEVYNANESGILLELLFVDQTDLGRPLKRAEKKRINYFKNFRTSEHSFNVMALGSEPLLRGCNLVDMASKKKYTDVKADYCIDTLKGKTPIGAEACQIINYENGSYFRVNPEKCEVYSVNGKVTGPASEAAARAEENSRLVYDYYSDRFGRRSFDGLGTVLRSVVNAGYKLSNAGWFTDRGFMAYGAGDGVEMGDFTQLIDVAGHEMTHGVVSTTAKLSMMDEPGALNEATADYFGLMISRYNDWTIGKGLFLKDPERGLRSIWQPSLYSDKYMDETGTMVEKPNPEKYSQRYQVFGGQSCNETNDRCFVHLNSTIMSHGYYWIHRALGKHLTQDLIFLALTQYYTPDTNFHEAAGMIRQACRKLYDESTCVKVDDALSRVEL